MTGFPKLLMDLLSKKETETFINFLKSFDIEKKEWYLISDYCIDDSNKLNDVFTFSLLLNHDNIHNIKNFVKSSAPKDLKNAKDVSDSFLSYINAQIIYHFSFIIPQENKLVKSYYTNNRILGELDSLYNIIENSKADFSNDINDYFIEVQKKIKQVKIESLRRTFNEKLMRKILLTAIFGSVILYLLKVNSSPTKVMWISDRDAITDKYDGISYDLMFLIFNLFPKDNFITQNTFDFIYQPSETSGKNFYDELIRIPDYIAGTLASIDLENKNQLETMHEKHQTFVAGSITNSINQANIKIEYKNSILSVYNVKWVI